MKIKKEFIQDILNGTKKFEIRNNQDRQGIYNFPCDISTQVYYLKYIDGKFLYNKNHIFVVLDDLFKDYNGLNAKENLDKKSYEWIKKNKDIFWKTGIVNIYLWIPINEQKPETLEIVE